MGGWKLGVKKQLYGAQKSPTADMSTDPLFMKVGAEYYWYHNDHLGTPQMMTTGSGAVAWSAEYTSFGNAEVDFTSTVSNNLRFAGQYYDAETRLHYNYHRYYDPATGRYIASDPIGLNGGMNLYAYVQSDPINWVDSTGLTRACPKNIECLKTQMENWRKYPGDSTKYHCGFDGYLEVRNNKSDRTPVGECFYDTSGQLVDENHPYKGCRGTPDEYPVPDDWWNHPDIVYDHFVKDKGGPNGPSDVADDLGDEAYEESRRYFRENPTYYYPYANSPNPRDRKRKIRQW